MQTPPRLTHVFVDGRDLERLGAFWAALLGVRIARRADPYLLLEPLPDGLTLGFQAVEEPKVGKARIHVDLTVDDLAAAIIRAEELGARRLSGERDGMHRWRVMADPEGNEFCLIAPR